MTYENNPQGPVWGPQGSQGPQQGYYQQPPQQQPKKKKGKGKWIVLIVVLLLILGFCAVNSGDDDSGTTSGTTSSEVAPAPESEDVWTPEERLVQQSDNAKSRLALTFGDCEWENVGEHMQYSEMYECSRDRVLLIVSENPSLLQSILEEAEGTGQQGYYVTEDNWAVVTSSQGDANRAWDVMGATGNRAQFQN